MGTITEADMEKSETMKRASNLLSQQGSPFVNKTLMSQANDTLTLDKVFVGGDSKGQLTENSANF